MLLRFLFTALLLISLTSTAVACSCVGIEDKSVGEHLSSDSIFVGTPISTRYEPSDNDFGPTVITTFQVDQIFRGNPEKRKIEISHRQDGAACGVWFMLGERQMVSAYETDAGFNTSSCSNPLPEMVIVNYFEKHENTQLMSHRVCEEEGLIDSEQEVNEETPSFSISSNPCRLYNDDSRRLNWKAWQNWIEEQNFTP